MDVAAWYADRHPSGADRFFTDFQQARDVLAAFPRAGRIREDLREDLRSYVVHPFQIFYTVEEAARHVIIERVLHGHLDIATDDF